MENKSLKTIYARPLQLGESPIWDERLQALYFVDIFAKELYVQEYKKNKTNIHKFTEYISSLALTTDPNIIYIGLESGVYKYHIQSLEKEFLIQPEKKPNYRYNDGAVDPYGNWLLGSMNNINNGPQASLQPDAALYHINSNQHNVLLSGVTISNGIAFQDNWLYFIDSKKNTIQRFVYNGADLKEPSEIFKMTNGTTLDGMCISQSNKLYIANWGGYKILVFDLTQGKITDEIALPVLNPTSCTFGGPDLDELFITTASLDDTDNGMPGVYSIKLPDKGTAANKLDWK